MNSIFILLSTSLFECMNVMVLLFSTLHMNILIENDLYSSLNVVLQVILILYSMFINSILDTNILRYTRIPYDHCLLPNVCV